MYIFGLNESLLQLLSFTLHGFSLHYMIFFEGLFDLSPEAAGLAYTTWVPSHYMVFLNVHILFEGLWQLLKLTLLRFSSHNMV